LSSVAMLRRTGSLIWSRSIWTFRSDIYTKYRNGRERRLLVQMPI
jgi:hypothetical protein